MPLATQTNSGLATQLKYIWGKFTRRLAPRIDALRRRKDVTGRELVTDGGVLVETDDGDELTLAQLKARTSSTPPENRDYCPVDECGTIKVFRKSGRPGSRDNPEPYRCANGHHFETPATYEEARE